MRALELKIPPVLVALAAGLLMGGLARAWPGLTIDVPHGRAIGSAFAVAGALLALAGVFRFRRHATTVHPHHPQRASTLVTSGVYRVTRNPMYLGLALMLVGACVRLGSPLALLGLVAYVAYMNRFQIGPEERALTGLFGEAYTAYTRSVRRWL